MSRSLRVLIVEDDENDALLLLRELKRAGLDVTHQRVQTADALRAALVGQPWDIVLSDFAMPGFTGLDALTLLQANSLDLPFILVSGTVGEETAVAAMKAGAQDYLLKGDLNRLAAAIEREVDQAAVRRGKRQAEKLYRSLVEHMPAVTYTSGLNAVGSAIYISPRIEALLGYTQAEWTAGQGLWAERLHPADRDRVLGDYAQSAVSSGPFRSEYRLLARDGRVVWVRDEGAVVRDDTGQPQYMHGVVLDITERVRAEAQIRQNAARAEALASLSRVLFETGLDVQAGLDAVSRTLVQLIGDACIIALLSTDGQWLKPVAVAHSDPDAQTLLREAAFQRSYPVGVGTIGRVAQTGEPALVEEISPEQIHDFVGRAFHPYLDRFGLHSLLAVPLREPGGLIGVVALARGNSGRTYTAADQTFLQELADRAALAVANARLFEQARDRGQELGALYSLSTLLNQARAEAEILPPVLSQARGQLQAEGAAVVLLDPDHGRFVVALAEGFLEPATGFAFPADQGLSQRVLETRRPYAAADLAAEPLRLGNLPVGELIGPVALVPVASEVEVLGVLIAARRRRPDVRPFAPEEVQLLAAIGEIAGICLRRARLSSETERRLQHLAALRKIDMTISASLDQRLTLNVVLREVTAQLQVDAASVLLLNSHTQTLDYAAGHGFRTQSLQHTRLRLGQGHPGKAALERRVVHVADLRRRSTDFLRSPHFAAEDFVAYFAAPLLTKGQVVGVLELFHRAALEPDREWLDFLETLAGQAAIAVENSALFDGLQRSNVELSLAYETTLEGWSKALDLRDKETEGHTQRVTELTLRLAHAFNLSQAELAHVRRGALLHDIGKMGIPDHILLKSEPLTDDEWVIMRKHPIYAYELLSPIAYLRPALDIPYCHHEMWDGTGYPRGLKAEQIPLVARVFAVVDVWDALRSDRPYRAAWPAEKVRRHIRDLSGAHFEPRVVEMFLHLEGIG